MLENEILNKAEGKPKAMDVDVAEDSLQTREGGDALYPGRKAQLIEVAVFLFLIVPSMSTSFLIGNQSAPGFILAAILSILSDLGLVSLVFFFIWRNREPPRQIGWSGQSLPSEIGWGLVLFLPVMYGANLLEGALHTAGLSAPTKLPSFLVASDPSKLVMAIFLVIVVAIAEETIFRGYLILRLKFVLGRPWAAVLLSSAVFSIGHGYEGMAGVISVFALGVVLGVIYLWRKSLIAPMMIHFLIDFSSIVLAGWMKATS